MKDQTCLLKANRPFAFSTTGFGKLCLVMAIVMLLLSTSPSKAVTTFFVTNTANTGAGSLAQAITSANASVNSGGNDIISFTGFSGTIVLSSNLPNITDPVTIDGTTASAYSFVTYTPVIGLQGITNGFVVNAAGLGSIITAIAIWHTSSDAILINAGANNVRVSNCWIGFTLAGVLPGAPAANKVNGHGIDIMSANNCTIGGGANTMNVISGCVGHGIFVQSGSTGTLISSNYIGLRSDGSTIIANLVHGIVLNNAPSSTIGGVNAVDRNVIAGNGNGSATNGQGISIEAGSNNCFVLGSYIGTDAVGTTAKANNLHGINIQNSTGTTIGGSALGSRNIISGNTLSGINIVATSTNTIIKGNYIGLNAAGTAKIANLQHGIYITASNNCIIGGSSKADRNIISGNGSTGGNNGISIASCNSHKIKGNFIGTNANGLAAIGNYDAGISLSTSTGDSIGGQTFMERNVCSGNALSHGIYLFDVDNSRFYGNYLGTDSTGLAALPNVQHGMHADGGCDANYWYNNVASGNTQGGLDFLSTTGNFFYGNFVGVGKDGATKISNAGNGMRFGNGSTGVSQNNVIGGILAGQRNYVSGNGVVWNSGAHGILFDGGSLTNTIKGNYLGSDITGSVAIGNSGSGVFFLDGSNSNVVGGTNAGEGNLICCSTGDEGIRMNISSSNVVYGNLIGVNAAQVPASGFGNYQYGVFIVAYSNLSKVANSNIIGDVGAGANIISNNGSDGVNVFNTGGTAANFNRIIGNKIYCNGGLGINLQSNSATENQGIVAPVVTSSTANVVSGTGATGNTIHAYVNGTNTLAGCDCEGEYYLGSAVVAGGAWSITHNMNLSSSAQLTVTATQTNPTNSTSEFWVCSSPLPLKFISFQASRISAEEVSLVWKTTDEINTKTFSIERSFDGVLFESVGSKDAKGNYGSINNYDYQDMQSFNGTIYYRIKQIDIDGKYTYSEIRSTSLSTEDINISPNPNNGSFSLTRVGSSKKCNISLINSLAQVVSQFEKYSDSQGTIDVNIDNLEPGIYFVNILSGDKSYTKKILIVR